MDVDEANILFVAAHHLGEFEQFVGINGAVLVGVIHGEHPLVPGRHVLGLGFVVVRLIVLMVVFVHGHHDAHHLAEFFRGKGTVVVLVKDGHEDLSHGFSVNFVLVHHLIEALEFSHAEERVVVGIGLVKQVRPHGHFKFMTSVVFVLRLVGGSRLVGRFTVVVVIFFHGFHAFEELLEGERGIVVGVK